MTVAPYRASRCLDAIRALLWRWPGQRLRGRCRDRIAAVGPKGRGASQRGHHRSARGARGPRLRADIGGWRRSPGRTSRLRVLHVSGQRLRARCHRPARSSGSRTAFPNEPKPRAKNKDGVQLFGPAGGGIWGAPTIDARRGVLYIGTGNGFAEPAQPTTNAVLAFELETGRIRWAKQTVPNDVWIWQCPPENPDQPELSAQAGAGLRLRHLAAHRPNAARARAAGGAAEVGHAVRARSGQERRHRVGVPLRAGKRARRSVGCGGRRAQCLRWHRRLAVAIRQAGCTPSISTPASECGSRRRSAKLCAGGADERCYAAQGGAVTVIPGVVFSGGSDGGLRAYSTRDGSIVWQVDTNREFPTVNGVKANGGNDRRRRPGCRGWHAVRQLRLRRHRRARRKCSAGVRGAIASGRRVRLSSRCRSVSYSGE